MRSHRQAALYVRVSTSDQNTELQTRELREYARARGLSVQVYEDKATGRNGNRPALKRLMEDVRSGKVSLVVCWKLDRLFRSLQGLIGTLSELQGLGVEFVAIRSNLDLSSSSGRLMMHILGAVAEFEAELTRERVRAGLANARAKGVRLGAERKLDYAEIRAMRARGDTLSAIAARFGVTKSAVHKALRSCT